jgi:hypothetical protein
MKKNNIVRFVVVSSFVFVSAANAATDSQTTKKYEIKFKRYIHVCSNPMTPENKVAMPKLVGIFKNKVGQSFLKGKLKHASSAVEKKCITHALK